MPKPLAADLSNPSNDVTPAARNVRVECDSDLCFDVQRHRDTTILAI